MEIPPGVNEHAEREHRIATFPRAQTRGEGIEADDGNDTVTNNAGDV